MQSRPERNSSSRALLRRRVAAVTSVVAAFAFTAGAVAGRTQAPDARATAEAPEGVARLMMGERRLADLDLSRLARGGKLDAAAVFRATEAALPARVATRRARAHVTYRIDAATTAPRVLARGVAGGEVQVAREFEQSRTAVTVVRQELRNNCESAALSMLLAAVGKRVDQRALQAQFPRSGPLDPRGEGGRKVWGDPAVGYVGRPEGGGVAGGFGIYPQPVAATAAKHGVRLKVLEGAPPARVYERLRAGRPVMVWIGLSDGPYGTWRSPSGRRIRVNFGEHTVVLHGIRADGSVRVANPLQGTAETWGRSQFELMWKRLGRRALIT